MNIHLTFCDVPGYEYDISGARNAGYTTEFDYDASDLTPLSPIGSKPFQQELLDGTMFELKKRHRYKQAFTTNPDLALNGINMTVVSYDESTGAITKTKAVWSIHDLLTAWAMARSRWITTPFNLSQNVPLTDIKVVLKSPDLTIAKHDNALIMEKTTIEFETAQSY